jgi:hypothetical protein
LLADVQGEVPGRDRRRQSPDRCTRPENAAILEVEPPFVLDLVVRVRADVETGAEAQPFRRLEKDILPQQHVADLLFWIVRRFLEEKLSARFHVAALGQRLCRRGSR